MKRRGRVGSPPRRIQPGERRASAGGPARAFVYRGRSRAVLVGLHGVMLTLAGELAIGAALLAVGAGNSVAGLMRHA